MIEIDEDTGELISGSEEMFTLLKAIGGTFNISVLSSALNNFDIALKATNTALNSTGSATREYETALDSVDAKLIRHSIVEILYI